MTSWRSIADTDVVRFLAVGLVNTIATFSIYLGLQTALNYQLAYFLSYALGILLAYFMNSLFVFKTPVSFGAFIRFPLVYVVQYIVGAILLELLVRVLNIPPTIAPLLVIVATLPLTFLLSRHILSKK